MFLSATESITRFGSVGNAVMTLEEMFKIHITCSHQRFEEEAVAGLGQAVGLELSLKLHHSPLGLGHLSLFVYLLTPFASQREPLRARRRCALVIRRATLMKMVRIDV